jgi:hypothetical protein
MTRIRMALNKEDATKFLSFPTVIYTPCYNKQFRSYDILNSTGLLEFCYEQN